MYFKLQISEWEIFCFQWMIWKSFCFTHLFEVAKRLHFWSVWRNNHYDVLAFHYATFNQLINSCSVKLFKNSFIELSLLSPFKIQAKFTLRLTLTGSTVNLLNPREYSDGCADTFSSVFVITALVISLFVLSDIKIRLIFILANYLYKYFENNYREQSDMQLTLYSRKTGRYGSARVFAFSGVPAVDSSVFVSPLFSWILSVSGNTRKGVTGW